jgi:hypothetical protein
LVDVHANDVILLDSDRERTKLGQIIISPNPVKTSNVDLQVKGIRLPNILMKRYESATNNQIILENNSFSMNIFGKKGVLKDTLKLTINSIIQDIHEGMLIYSLFYEWMQGNPITIIISDEGRSVDLPAEKQAEDTFMQEIRHFYRLYYYLDLIQTTLKIKINLPKVITIQEQQLIYNIGTFIEGKKMKITEISLNLASNIPEFLKSFSNPAVFTMTCYDGGMNLFGHRIILPSVVEGVGGYVKNYSDVEDRIKKGQKEIKIIVGSHNNDLFMTYAPQNPLGEASQ